MLKNDELRRCIKIFERGGLIVAPSDTVYGLVCDATNEAAVKKLIAVKNRPWGKPISVFVDGFGMIDSTTVIGSHKKVLESLLPGPFTVVLPSKGKVCPLLESERQTLGVRYTTFPWIQELVHRYGKPLTATSANISGRPPHYEVKGFFNDLSKEKQTFIDYAVDFGKLAHNKPSTLVDFTAGDLQLLRKGEILPTSATTFRSSSAHETKKTAGFLLEKYFRFVEKKPLVFILEGEMGVGKTVFAQGMGDILGINTIISPTYVVYYEYPTNKSPANLFLHADLYNIEEKDEFTHLGLEHYLHPGVVLCIEWGDRVGPLFKELQKKAHIVFVDIEYTSETERLLSVREIHT